MLYILPIICKKTKYRQENNINDPEIQETRPIKCFSFKSRALSSYFFFFYLWFFTDRHRDTEANLHLTHLICPFSLLHIFHHIPPTKWFHFNAQHKPPSLSLNPVFITGLLGGFTVQRREECLGFSECTSSNKQPDTAQLLNQMPLLRIRLSGTVLFSKLSQCLCRNIWEHC